MIEVEHVVKTFTKHVPKQGKQEFNAVDGISLRVQDGEILGILGANGAGKTTLLRMMGRLMKPSSGKVTITAASGEVYDTELAIKKQIGYLSGNTKLYEKLSIREMLTLFGELYEMKPEEIRMQINEITKLLSLSEFVDNRIGKLSTGQTQRANIARCLIHNPAIYIFDEPTLGLDIISSHAIVEFMRQEKKRGKTVVYSTHYLEEAESLCDRIVMIHHGRLVAQGTPKELKAQYQAKTLRNVFTTVIGEEVQHESEKS